MVMPMPPARYPSTDPDFQAALHARYLAAVAALVPEPAVTLLPGAARATRSTRSPLSGQLGVPVPVCLPDDAAHALQTARAAQPEWEGAGLEHRRRVLLRLHYLVWRHQNHLLDLIGAETGKSRADAFEEMADVALTARHYARAAPRILRERRHAGVLPVLGSVWERRVAKGVVAVIAPWNYPFTLAASDALAALVAGNAVVLKPDSFTPLTGLAVAELMWAAGVPREIFQVVTGPGAELGPELIGGADYLMFTGSTATGRVVAAEAGAALIGVSAELGGKNPLVVFADADLGRAVRGAVKACFSNSGQLCISMERMYVHEDIWDQFVPAFVAATEQLRLGAGMDWDADLGPLVSQAHLEVFREYVADAVEKGARVLTGGRARPDVAPTAYAPTVLVDVPRSARLYAEETFGPLVSITPFRDNEEMLALVNESPYGLNASLWTGNARQGRALAERIRCGTVNVNEGYIATWAATGAPMGGMGISGLGRRHGVAGLTKYTESQTIAVQRLMNIAPPAGVGAEAWAGIMRAYLVARRRLGL